MDNMTNATDNITISIGSLLLDDGDEGGKLGLKFLVAGVSHIIFLLVYGSTVFMVPDTTYGRDELSFKVGELS